MQQEKRKEINPLPSSKSKKFWEGAEIIKCDPEESTTGKEHCWIQRGNSFICIGCHISHGLILNPRKYHVIEGSIVSKENGKILGPGIKKEEINKKSRKQLTS